MRSIASVGIIAAALAAAAPTSSYGQDQPPQQMIGTALYCDQNGCVESGPANVGTETRAPSEGQVKPHKRKHRHHHRRHAA